MADPNTSDATTVAKDIENTSKTKGEAEAYKSLKQEHDDYASKHTAQETQTYWKQVTDQLKKDGFLNDMAIEWASENRDKFGGNDGNLHKSDLQRVAGGAYTDQYASDLDRTFAATTIEQYDRFSKRHDYGDDYTTNYQHPDGITQKDLDDLYWDNQNGIVDKQHVASLTTTGDGDPNHSLFASFDRFGNGNTTDGKVDKSDIEDWMKVADQYRATHDTGNDKNSIFNDDNYTTAQWLKDHWDDPEVKRLRDGGALTLDSLAKAAGYVNGEGKPDAGAMFSANKNPDRQPDAPQDLPAIPKGGDKDPNKSQPAEIGADINQLNQSSGGAAAYQRFQEDYKNYAASHKPEETKAYFDQVYGALSPETKQALAAAWGDKDGGKFTDDKGVFHKNELQKIVGGAYNDTYAPATDRYMAQAMLDSYGTLSQKHDYSDDYQNNYTHPDGITSADIKDTLNDQQAQIGRADAIRRLSASTDGNPDHTLLASVDRIAGGDDHKISQGDVQKWLDQYNKMKDINPNDPVFNKANADFLQQLHDHWDDEPYKNLHEGGGLLSSSVITYDQLARAGGFSDANDLLAKEKYEPQRPGPQGGNLDQATEGKFLDYFDPIKHPDNKALVQTDGQGNTFISKDNLANLQPDKVGLTQQQLDAIRGNKDFLNPDGSLNLDKVAAAAGSNGGDHNVGALQQYFARSGDAEISDANGKALIEKLASNPQLLKSLQDKDGNITRDSIRAALPGNPDALDSMPDLKAVLGPLNDNWNTLPHKSDGSLDLDAMAQKYDKKSFKDLQGSPPEGPQPDQATDGKFLDNFDPIKHPENKALVQTDQNGNAFVKKEDLAKLDPAKLGLTQEQFDSIVKNKKFLNDDGSLSLDKIADAAGSTGTGDKHVGALQQYFARSGDADISDTDGKALVDRLARDPNLLKSLQDKNGNITPDSIRAAAGGNPDSMDPRLAAVLGPLHDNWNTLPHKSDGSLDLDAMSQKYEHKSFKELSENPPPEPLAKDAATKAVDDYISLTARTADLLFPPKPGEDPNNDEHKLDREMTPETVKKALESPDLTIAQKEYLENLQKNWPVADGKPITMRQILESAGYTKVENGKTVIDDAKIDAAEQAAQKTAKDVLKGVHGLDAKDFPLTEAKINQRMNDLARDDRHDGTRVEDDPEYQALKQLKDHYKEIADAKSGSITEEDLQKYAEAHGISQKEYNELYKPKGGQDAQGDKDKKADEIFNSDKIQKEISWPSNAKGSFYDNVYKMMQERNQYTHELDNLSQHDLDQAIRKEESRILLLNAKDLKLADGSTLADHPDAMQRLQKNVEGADPALIPQAVVSILASQKMKMYDDAAAAEVKKKIKEHLPAETGNA